MNGHEVLQYFFHVNKLVSPMPPLDRGLWQKAIGRSAS